MTTMRREMSTDLANHSNPQQAEKACLNCLLVKPIDAFCFKDKAHTIRLNLCKSCESERKLAWRKNNRERVRAQERQRGWRRKRQKLVSRERKSNPLFNPQFPTVPPLPARYVEPPSSRGVAARTWKYGITPRQLNCLAEAQNNVCAICGEQEKAGRPLNIDHCHATGVVRSLLCSRCNWGLGNFRDNPELMELAAAYIRSHRKQVA